MPEAYPNVKAERAPVALLGGAPARDPKGLHWRRASVEHLRDHTCSRISLASATSGRTNITGQPLHILSFAVMRERQMRLSHLPRASVDWR